MPAVSNMQQPKDNLPFLQPFHLLVTLSFPCACDLSHLINATPAEAAAISASSCFTFKIPAHVRATFTVDSIVVAMKALCIGKYVYLGKQKQPCYAEFATGLQL